MGNHTCECGASFDSSQKLAAHTRWECELADNNSENANNRSSGENNLNEPDNNDYMGIKDTIQIKDKAESEYRCSECNGEVKPGKNCQDCGAELSWG